MSFPDYDDGGMAMSAREEFEEFKERGKSSPTWHMLSGGKDGIWSALCGSTEAKDSEDYMHSLTNRTERVTCDKCKAIMAAQNVTR